MPLSVASIIDHTLLGPCAGGREIIKLCAEARKYGFASGCVAPRHVALCKKLLRGSRASLDHLHDLEVVLQELTAQLIDALAFIHWRQRSTTPRRCGRRRAASGGA